MISVEEWMEEIKALPGSAAVGMMLAHRGVVRGTTRAGDPVRGMDLQVDRDRLAQVIAGAQDLAGVFAVRAWVNEGRLAVGDDIMKVVVAGDIREHVFDALQKLVAAVKTEVVMETELL